jgi:hypothetical protein
MRNGPIPLNAHAAIEPLIGLLLILAPWIFSFSDVSDAKTVSIVLGALVIVGGLLTRWRYSVVKLIPLRAHFIWDFIIGAVLIASPFLFNFDDNDNATWFMIILGIAEIGAALATRWEPDPEAERRHPSHGVHA